MEDWTKQEQGDTASTSFYPSRSHSPTRQAASSTPFDADIIQSLEEQTSKTKIVIATNWDWLKRLESKEDLQGYMRETEQELTLLHNKNQGELAITRDQFDKGISQLERQGNSIRKGWKNLKEMHQAQLEESLLELKTERIQNEADISSLLKDTNARIKGKFATFNKEMKEAKRGRIEKTNTIMQQIETLRGSLELKIQAERRKRMQYEDIVLGLLSRTCDQGERLLRRIC